MKAIQAVWQQFYAYNTLPSYQGKTISVMPGQTCWIPDTNGVTDIKQVSLFRMVYR